MTTTKKLVLALPMTADEAESFVEALNYVGTGYDRAARVLDEIERGVSSGALGDDAVMAMAGLAGEALGRRAEEDGERLSILADRIGWAIRETIEPHTASETQEGGAA